MKWNILHTAKHSDKHKTSISDIKAVLLQNRTIEGAEQINQFLSPDLSMLEQEFFDTKQLEKASSRIKTAIEKNEQILIYSDYDVDGVTGTAILWETLRDIGANTLPYVPKRMTEGYGLSVTGIDNLLEQHPETRVIITVDNGITANEAVAYATNKGIDVIITDHHTKSDAVPEAHSIVHTTALAGSGVALVFATILKKQSNAVSKYQWNNEHLALAALGTIADLVPLTNANRVVAKYGLASVNSTERLGLITLLDEIDIRDRDIGTYEVGFMIGPRINASGRLGHALDALRLLCTKSQSRAWMLASSIDALNTKRKKITQQAIDQAKEVADEKQGLLFVADESYHEGVIGLIAGGLVDEFYRPAIAVSKGATISKGSARSIKGINIIEAIREHTDLLINAGGHPMAAGFSIETKNLETFKDHITATIAAQITDDILEKTLSIDLEISLSQVDWPLYECCQEFRPFGVGNKEPVFVSKQVRVADASVIGRDRSHLKLQVYEEGKRKYYNAIAFGKADIYEQLSKDALIDIAYVISKNEWNGSVSLQLVVRDIHT